MNGKSSGRIRRLIVFLGGPAVVIGVISSVYVFFHQERISRQEALGGIETILASLLSKCSSEMGALYTIVDIPTESLPDPTVQECAKAYSAFVKEFNTNKSRAMAPPLIRIREWTCLFDNLDSTRNYAYNSRLNENAMQLSFTRIKQVHEAGTLDLLLWRARRIARHLTSVILDERRAEVYFRAKDEVPGWRTDLEIEDQFAKTISRGMEQCFANY